MARLVIVTHQFDRFAYRFGPEKPIESGYLLYGVIKLLESRGHSWVVTKGPKREPGHVALLHVDSTIVDEEYLALGAHYPVTINFGTGDISKRKISKLLVSRDDSWDGKVIVKANLNNRGVMEDLHNNRAAKEGLPPPHPGVIRTGPYRVFDSVATVDPEVWDDSRLVVERFVPEPDDDGFVLRTWVFMGSRERCTRMVTPSEISKAGDVLRYEPIEVPPELRAERERLKFDYGKFDFVMQDGVPVLLDANRTPGTATAIRELMDAGAPNLAEGLEEILLKAAA